MREGWQTYKIDEIATFYNNKRIPLNSRERENKRGVYPYYGASGIVDYVDDYLFDGEFVLISEDGENLRSRNTPIAFKANGKFWVNNHAHILQGRQPFLNDWIVYYFKNLDLNAYITGAVQPKLNKENLQLIEIPMPSEEEAKQIVSILASLDDKIELNRQMNATLEATAQAIFKEWFVDFRFPGATGEMEESELGPIPKGWRLGQLKEICEIKNGFAFKSEDYISENGYPIIRTMNFDDQGYVNNKNQVYISHEKATEFENFNLEVFDLCVVMVGGSLGKTALITDFNLPALQNQNMWSFKPKNAGDRFWMNLQIQNLIQQSLSTATGSARDFFRKDYFYGIEMNLPPLATRQMFEKTLRPCYSLISQKIMENSHLINIRDSLLPKLMSGDLGAG